MKTSKGPTLTARDLHLWRGERHLLRGVSFALNSGELLQFIGPNGVGKTSLLRACCGLLPIESGELLWNGESIHRVRDEYHASLVYLAHTNALKADLSAAENLRFELRLRKEINEAALQSQMQALGIAACADLPARALSAGQKRRLALARVGLSDAPLWILDEPTTNLDVEGVAIVEQLMLRHLQSGGAIVAAAHHRLLGTYSQSKTLELRA